MLAGGLDRLTQKIDIEPWVELHGLPDSFSKEFRNLQDSFTGRSEYIKNIGFVLLTENFIMELIDKFKELKIKNFIEIKAGHGAFTLALFMRGIPGIGYTQPLNGTWGLGQESPIYKMALEKELLFHEDIRDITLKNIPDITIANWIPYGGGDATIKYMEQNPSKYFLVTSEGRGGCIAGDKFFDWLADKYEHIWTSSQYQSFYAIYDQVDLYKRKG